MGFSPLVPLALRLSLKKTLITDMRKTSSVFSKALGFEFSNANSVRLGYDNKGKLKRTCGWSIVCKPDRVRLLNQLYMKGYCQLDGFPRKSSWLSTLDLYTMIDRFHSVLRGLANFYGEFLTYRSTLYCGFILFISEADKVFCYKNNCSKIEIEL